MSGPWGDDVPERDPEPPEAWRNDDGGEYVEDEPSE